IVQFEKVLRLEGNHPDAHYNLGLLLGQLNKHEEALKHIQKAVTEAPSDFSARFLLGQTLLKVGRLDEAEKELSRVVEAAPSNEDALLDLVTILLQKKMYGPALEALEKGHERSPQNGRTTVTLAFLLVASPQYEKRDGQRALKLAQGAYETTRGVNHGVLVAMALGEMGRCDEAAAWVRKLADKASEQRQPDVLVKLKAELNRYERERPCRPTPEMFSDQQLPR
ncbi:MAG TPA: tetratricopeptide repeat protein, partial [Pyrinomonadaceae bacterium]|nr:tetratricopeptide repeat protein [Pyrinomonadaceae bacterium]